MTALTLQHVLQQGYADYARTHKLPAHQRRAAEQLIRCRTAALGGHVQRCENGHVHGVWYNSCRHRSCPHCRGLPMAQWLEQQHARLLDCAHRHMVFTIPHELLPLWRSAQAVMAEVLFAAVRETVLTLCRDPKHLGAEPGFLCALHTWGRSLTLHPHIHCLISEGGGDHNQHWRTPRRACFLPARVVMSLFRGKLLAKLRQLSASPKLKLPPSWTPQQLINLCNKLGRKKWNVNVRERYDHGAGVVTYLARYLRGGPFNNSQLHQLTDTHVSFSYVPHDDPHHRFSTITLDMNAFFQRYLQHMPLRGKPSVRHYGSYASGKRTQLNVLREQFSQPPVTKATKITWQQFLQSFTLAAKLKQCAQCGAPIHFAEAIPRSGIELHNNDPPTPTTITTRLAA